MAQIAHLIRIRGNAPDVYERVATTAGIERWFTRAVSTDYREGGILELRFGDDPVRFDVTAMSAPRRIVWRCTSPENSWFETDVVFEFEQQQEKTIVRFDHLGWPTVDDRFRDCSLSWAYFLESLRMLVEEGKGTPEDEAPPCESPDE